MDIKNAKKRIKKLYDNLSKWSFGYYTNDSPTVSDITYDEALNELDKLEKLFPELKIADSPTDVVGSKLLSSFKKIKHVKPMLSLKNAFNNEDLILFNNNLSKHWKVEYFVEPKIDGLSISITYDNGVLVKAVTRGDGFIGEDVTRNIRQIRDIPKTINYSKKLEVRGEIYIPLNRFFKINVERLANGEKQFVNPRNAAAGTMRQLDEKIVYERGLESKIYWAYNIDNDCFLSTKQSEIIKELKQLGFNVVQNSMKADDISEVINSIKSIESQKSKLNYEIDGIVIKVNNIDLYEKIGFTSKFPKWAIAYKFPAEIKETKLIKIFSTVGRTGRITYNAQLSGVKISGTTIKRSTLHNSNYIKELDIREGDVVRIKKAGEIIPKIVSVNLLKRPKNSLPWKEDVNCPACGSKLHRYEDEVDQYCINENCQARLIESITHFISRDAMNIEGFSTKQVKKFVSLGWLKNIADIYTLKNKEDQILKLEGYQTKSVTSLINSIEYSKENELYRLIFGLGIRYIGLKASKDLANVFLNLNNIINTSVEKLLKQNDFGDVRAKSVINYFSRKKNIDVLNQLNKLGVNPKTNNNFSIKNNKFFNKKIVITGTIDGGTRNEIGNFFEMLGAKIMSSISNKTDYLIVGKNPSQNKLNKIDKTKIINVININNLEK